MIRKANINWTAKQLSKMVDKNSINFDNAVQRGYVWDKKRKSLLIDLLSEYWSSLGIPVQIVRYGEDFYPGSPEFLFADSIKEFIPGNSTPDSFRIILVEHASLQFFAIPKALLQEASINLTVFWADKIWSDRNKQLFDRLKELAGSTPTLICLNNVDKSYTGMLPPQTTLKKYLYRYLQNGIASSGNP